MREPSKPLRAGDLRHPVTIHAPAGTDAVAATDVATNVPMAISALPLQFQAREKLDLGGMQSQTLYTVSCRYRTDVKPVHVLREVCCTRRQFQILSIIPSDQRDALDMTCVANG